MPRVIHFEIPADNPERAVTFYEKVFGWNINKWEGPADYWLAMTGPDDVPGINGAITRRADRGTVTYALDVPSVDEFTQRIVEAGGSVITPKMPIPGIGWHAYCKDTEGNTFGIMEADPSAR